MSRPFQLFAAVLFCAAAAPAQQPAPTATATPARSHVERFSTPEMRAGRAESDASVKLASDPNDTEALNLRAAARVRLGKYKEAHEDLRRAVSLKPASAEYQANLGYVLWKLGRVEESIAAERAALRLDDKNLMAHHQLGRVLLRLGDPKQLEEAAEHLRRALELNARQYEVRFELIAAYRALGRRADASTHLAFLRDAMPSDPRVFYISALLASDRDDIAAAVRDFKEALRRDPTLLGAWQDLGLAYVKLKQWPEAVETFAELARRDREAVDAAYLHALALFNAGKAAEAEAEARRALRINAGAAEAHTLLGVILAARGDSNDEAAESLAQSVALNPNSFDARFYLGRVQYALKDFAGAVSNLREAARLNPLHQEARFFLGTALESAGDSDAALAQYQELVKLDEQSAVGQLGLGALLVKQGKTAEAVAALRRAVALDANNFEGHWALGRALALGENFAEAVEALKKAVALAPRRSDAHYQLGLALRRAGRAEEAAREFAIVEQLNTEFRTSTKPRQ
ncbi:MAG TPA: tetratricopeptide repeat protein [Pyrinomonadaceae bacterium]|nr:tetratricopeptide repeat protein [Pyrinomonadaceae bacterium]